MPLMSLCSYPGCQAAVPYGQKYCERHADAGKKRDLEAKRERRRFFDRKRESASQRGYTSTWRRVAKRFLERDPYCEECFKQGKITPATEVDHIVPHKGDRNLMWDEKNWQSLCHRCHSRKTAREDGGFGNKVLEGVGRVKSR